MKASITGVLLLLALSSCGPSRYISQLESNNLKNLSLDYNIASVEVIDERLNVSNYPIRLPFVSSPGQLIKNVPVIDSTHRRIIESVIRKNCSGSGDPVLVEVHLLNGYKQFSATFWNETEKAYVQLQIRIRKGNDNFILCDSYADYHINSVDARSRRIERLYQLALEGAVINCLNYLDE